MKKNEKVLYYPVIIHSRSNTWVTRIRDESDEWDKDDTETSTDILGVETEKNRREQGWYRDVVVPFEVVPVPHQIPLRRQAHQPDDHRLQLHRVRAFHLDDRPPHHLVPRVYHQAVRHRLRQAHFHLDVHLRQAHLVHLADHQSLFHQGDVNKVNYESNFFRY